MASYQWHEDELDWIRSVMKVLTEVNNEAVDASAAGFSGTIELRAYSDNELVGRLECCPGSQIWTFTSVEKEEE